jgi:hypothetical protein
VRRAARERAIARFEIGQCLAEQTRLIAGLMR